jgi:ABC-2 type transport system ATP-binding protein
MLDEPTSALDPVGRRIVRDLLLELKSRGVAVLLNSHLLSEIERVCDRVAILVGGRIVARGSPAELAQARGVEVDLDGGVRAFPEASREQVPEIVAGLVGAGERVYGVRVLSSTLEETYLETVEAAS